MRREQARTLNDLRMTVSLADFYGKPGITQPSLLTLVVSTARVLKLGIVVPLIT